MTYFTNILESLSNTDMIRLMLHYMLGAPTQSSQGSKPSRPSTLARRRKSETLISNSALRVNDPSPDLITLTNILHGYLRSSNQQTVTASLRLLAVISRSWHQFANTALMKVQTAGRASERRSKSTYDQELEVLYSLAEEILDDDALEFSYESHLQDAQTMLESHPCAAQQLLPLNIKDLEKMTLRRPPRQRTIAPEDPLLATLLSLLENFLVNNIMVNLSLTEAFAALASCGETRLEGWLLASEFETTVHIGANNHNNSDDTLFSSNKRHVTSPVFARLESLVERIGRLKQEVQDYDIYLAERRHIFRVGGEIDDALADVPPRVSHESQDRKRADQKPLANASTISERVAVSSDVSRSISPRGRQRDHSTNHHPPPKSLVGRLSHLRISPSPSRSNPLERIHSASPLRKQSTSSMTSSPIPSPKGPPDALRQKVRLKVAPTQRRHARENGGSETSSLYSEASSLRCDDLEDFREVSLSHLLTNVIILQEFILELAAIVQVRASLFDELSLC